MPAMKWYSVAMRQARPLQLSRSKAITPRTFVPALSSSCAVAFSTTPVIRNANALAVMPLAPGDDDVARIARGHAHRHAVASETFVRFGRHQCIAFVERAPARDPGARVGDALVGLGVEAEVELVAIVHHHGRAPQIPRQGLIVQPDLEERRARIVRRAAGL